MFLISVPLKKELSLLLSSFEAHGTSFIKKQDQGRWYWQTNDLPIIFCIGGHGKSQFALQTQFWINKFQEIKHLITIGSAGSLSENTLPLDVVIATEIREHDYLQKMNPLASLPCFPTDTSLLNKLNDFHSEGFTAHQGAIASGDEDIVSKQRASELNKKTGALAVAWESAGGARSAQFNKLPYSEIRGITDNSQKNVSSDFFKNLPQAMEHCTQVLLHTFKT